ncbi:MAG: N-(5'-phosphoribosyl)anthranilate isomerase [Bacteroidales bacterium 36-12]|nr:MAG: N-(5'-phosphoribosyl)anthranilate isomerase [Bacteroidales bacterium 36-12]
MKIKICGMRDKDNIIQILSLKPDFIGFIFYEKSPRFVNYLHDFSEIQFDSKVKKTGVFVNANEQEIMQKVKMYDLQAVQLHGNELPSLCNTLKARGLIVIKAIQIYSQEDFKEIDAYSSYIDYFLFDTKTKLYGGSGEKFDWSVLKEYKLETPFFLSGGLDIDDIDNIKQFNHPKLIGIDLNSKFELSTGIKDYNKLQKFIKQIL